MLGLKTKDKPASTLCAVGRNASGGVAVCVDGAVGMDQPLVTQWGLLPTAPGDDIGLTLAQSVRRFRLSKARCTTLLDPQHYKLALTEKPLVPEAEREMALLWQTKDLFDLPIEEAVIDAFDFPTGENIPAEKSNAVYVVATRRTNIQNLANDFLSNDLALDAIDIPEMAQRNLARLTPEERQGVALLSMDKARCLVTITRNGELFVARHVDMNSNVFAKPDLAESEYERVSVEVQRSLDYYSTTLRQPPVRALYLVPTEFAARDLVTFLTRNLSVPVRNLDLLNRVSWLTPPDATQLGALSLYLGAALREWSPP